MRFSKAIAIAAGVTMLMALGTTSAMASRDNGHDDDEVTICFRDTGENWDRAQVADDEVADYEDTYDEVITVDDDEDCPADEVDEQDNDPVVTSSCSADDESGDSEVEQSGLLNLGNINLNLGNLLGNGLCGSNFLNHITASVLGLATGGGDYDSDSPEGCTAESHSGNSKADQDGLINLGNVNLNAGNLGGNLLCGSSFLNNATAAVAGTAHAGGSSNDDGDDDGGFLGILGGDDGLLSLLGGIF